MPLIQITPETLRVQAENIRKHNQDQEQTIKRLRNLVLSLCESWKGEAQDAFVAKFQSMDQTYRGLSEVLEGYAKLAITAADDFQNVDQNLKSMIQHIG